VGVCAANPNALNLHPLPPAPEWSLPVFVPTIR
jgi:hypothetical protein